MREVYLDNHSSTKPDTRVVSEMLPYLNEVYGNVQSMHSYGVQVKDAIVQSRNKVADLIGSKPEEIYFTSCGSEANNLTVKGVAEAYKQKGKHIIVSSIEHFSVLYAARRLSQQGYEVTYLPVDKYGIVSPDELVKSIRSDTILVSIQHANPEIGTIQNIPELTKLTHEKGVLFHTDAVCTVGVIPVDVQKLNVDLLTFSGTSVYNPPGTAVLYIKKGIRVIPQIDGGIQESGRRAGTENVAGIVALGKACTFAKSEMDINTSLMLKLRNRLITELPNKIEFIYLNGHPENRLPNNLNFSVEFIEGEGMLLLLDSKGIYLTSGSACTSKALKMSHVLTAIGTDAAIAQGSLLMTLSKYISDSDIDYILTELPPIVRKLREMSPLYSYFLKTGKRQEAGPGTDYDHHHEHTEVSELSEKREW